MDRKNIRLCFDEILPIPDLSETLQTGKEFVSHGPDNNVPQLLYEYYQDCYILQSAINQTADYISGAGIEILSNETSIQNYNDAGNLIVSRENETLTSLVNKLTLDYVLFGGLSFQIIYNKLGKIAELNYVDPRNIRLNEDSTKVFYNKNWGKYARNIKYFPIYDKENTKNSCIFYYKNPKSRGIYGRPFWNGALREVITLIEASKQNYNDMINGFSPNVLISFNNGIPPEDIQDEVEDAVIKKFSGSSGNKIMLIWNESKENSPEISSFSTEDYTERYNSVLNTCRNAILASFRCSGQLLGVLPEQTGFNSVEYEGAFKLFKTTVIQPIQNEIEDVFKQIGINIKLKEFEINFSN